MSSAPTAHEPAPLLVACLCAAWCRTCDTYRDTLLGVRAALAAARPAEPIRYAWIDIEDEADRIGDLDIEDFPTVLLARGDRVLFFGPLLPHAQTLQRLVESALADALGTPAAPLAADALALPARLRDFPAL